MNIMHERCAPQTQTPSGTAHRELCDKLEDDSRDLWIQTTWELYHNISSFCQLLLEKIILMKRDNTGQRENFTRWAYYAKKKKKKIFGPSTHPGFGQNRNFRYQWWTQPNLCNTDSKQIHTIISTIYFYDYLIK